MPHPSRLARWVLAACVSLAFACQPAAQPPAASAPAGPAASADAAQLAGRIGGKEVTAGEVDAWIMEQLFDQATRDRNPTKLYEIRERALQQMAGERALDAEAAKAKVDRDTLLETEVDKRSAVTDEEVAAFYEQHKQRYGERTLDQLKDPIRRQLEQQKRQKALEEYVGGLRESIGFESVLAPPRFEIAGEGASRGPADAPITLVEFSDYECPFCKNAEPIVEQVLERYPTQVRFVYRHFPLESIHRQARAASQAALCAGDQGKFWDYHRMLFAQSPKLGEAQLKDYAVQVGLDPAAFAACMAEKRHDDKITGDVAAGDQAGVSGTPAFFVNGLPLTAGARSADEFAKVIDAELERKGVPVPPKPAAAAPAPAAAPAAPPAAPAQAAAPQPAAKPAP